MAFPISEIALGHGELQAVLNTIVICVLAASQANGAALCARNGMQGVLMTWFMGIGTLMLWLLAIVVLRKTGAM